MKLFLSFLKFNWAFIRLKTFPMDTTQAFYSRPSYLSSFKVYHPKDIIQSNKNQIGGYQYDATARSGAKALLKYAFTPLALGMTHFIKGIAKKK